MSSKNTGPVLRCFYVQFPLNSVNIETLVSTSDDIKVTEYLQFLYPELDKISYAAIEAIPSKTFSCVRTTIDHDYEHCFILRFLEKTPKAILVITSEYNPFFQTVLDEVKKNVTSINIKELFGKLKNLQRTELICDKSAILKIVDFRIFKVAVKPNDFVINTLSSFGVNAFVDIVFKLLLEERYIFLASSIEQLNPIIQAFTFVLQPFVWQHIFVPILPMFLNAYLSSILPCIIGCTRGTYGAFVMEFGADDAGMHVVDLEKRQETSRCISENTLSNEEVGIFLSKLDFVVNNKESFQDEDVIDVFREMYQKIFGHLNKYFEKVGDAWRFHTQKFVESTPSMFKGFVEKFTQSQMFCMFVELQENNLLVNKPVQQFVINTTKQFQYDKLSKISPVERRCRSCLQEIKLDQPFFQSQDKSVLHRQCSKCIICDKFSDLKKCPLCVGFKQPVTQEEIENSYKKALERNALLQKKLNEKLSENVQEGDLTAELQNNFGKTIKEREKLLTLKTPQRRGESKPNFLRQSISRTLGSFGTKRKTPEGSPLVVSSTPIMPISPSKRATMSPMYPIPPPQDQMLFQPPPVPPKRPYKEQRVVTPDRQLSKSVDSNLIVFAPLRHVQTVDAKSEMTKSTNVKRYTTKQVNRPLPPVPQNRCKK
ncbi:DENN domain containing protein 2D, putative [Entamoeba invadens IP1]|uniref:DENN domain containing protein 2D, putative n=1 Tax=Entamoeba invadens IP1 TaxID=370355 RepID=A0A0A1TWQ0_ENTIV|nr:DENN domain containing protein 2D, putative [Entamoeba invadens IP1]ELP85622.1 DENN domain containing protein 2D, putative [Entamoeba invadens IP1]|eukprot:XP_004184968.1 DENN domain containing protein 2D, putative [Entamoeba invadens IP1]